jgi:hypothetical protein
MLTVVGGVALKREKVVKAPVTATVCWTLDWVADTAELVVPDRSSSGGRGSLAPWSSSWHGSRSCRRAARRWSGLVRRSGSDGWRRSRRG